MFQSLLTGSFFAPLIRHGATAVGVWLIAEGYADESTANEITGGLIAFGGLALSWTEKQLR